MSQENTAPLAIRPVQLGSAGETPKAPDGRVYVPTHNGTVDITDLFTPMVELGANLNAFQQNPYDYRPLLAMRRTGQRAMPLFNQLRQYPSLANQFGPIASSMSNMLKVAQSAAKLRIKAAADMARRPLQVIPISLSIAPNTTTGGIQIRNPYLGSTGGVAVSDQYKAPWSIVAFRTSNNENGQLQTVRITQWQIGGHDYVAAALGGVTFLGGGQASAQGWAASAFSETARKHHSTAFEPWNLTAESSAGWGFIMSETGYLQLAVNNGVNAASTYEDTWSVYVRATLCGSPFERHTDPSALAHAFIPMQHQYTQALRIAGDYSNAVIGMVGGASGQPQAAPWTAQLSTAQQQIQSFLDSPPPGIGEPLAYDSPAWGQFGNGQF